MRKIILMSLLLVPIILPIWASKRPNPRQELRRMIWTIFIFLMVWVVIGSWLFFRFSDE